MTKDNKTIVYESLTQKLHYQLLDRLYLAQISVHSWSKNYCKIMLRQHNYNATSGIICDAHLMTWYEKLDPCLAKTLALGWG